MIKVLQVVPSVNCCGGVENYIMNYFRHMDRDKFVFDFVFPWELENANFDDEIKSMGGKCFKIESFTVSNFSTIKKQIKKIIAENNYDIVHCHMANAAFLFFKAAKKSGIKARILHSHQAAAADRWTHALRNIPLLKIGKKRATKFIACSDLAGKYLFKKNYEVINNAIDVDKFRFNEEARKKIRAEYAIAEDEICIGHIGRFCVQKNHSFLIDAFYSMCKNHPDKKFKLLLAGDGRLKQPSEQKVKSLGIEDKVIFTGNVSNSNEFYSAFDLFVLPSLYEGLPVVGVEAQYSGLNVVTSDEVTEELNFSGNVSYLPLKSGAEKWGEFIYNLLIQKPDRNKVTDNDYDIEYQSHKLEEIYLSSLK